MRSGDGREGEGEGGARDPAEGAGLALGWGSQPGTRFGSHSDAQSTCSMYPLKKSANMQFFPTPRPHKRNPSAARRAGSHPHCTLSHTQLGHFTPPQPQPHPTHKPPPLSCQMSVLRVFHAILDDASIRRQSQFDALRALCTRVVRNLFARCVRSVPCVLHALCVRPWSRLAGRRTASEGSIPPAGSSLGVAPRLFNSALALCAALCQGPRLARPTPLSAALQAKTILKSHTPTP